MKGRGYVTPTQEVGHSRARNPNPSATGQQPGAGRVESRAAEDEVVNSFRRAGAPRTVSRLPETETVQVGTQATGTSSEAKYGRVNPPGLEPRPWLWSGPRPEASHGRHSEAQAQGIIPVRPTQVAHHSCPVQRVNREVLHLALPVSHSRKRISHHITMHSHM